MAGTEYNNIIVTKDLIRTFKTMGGEVHACNRISIEVPEKQMTILRGRSGSGKTTLINMLGTLDRPTSGLISFDGQDITKMSDSQRDKLRRTKIGFVFQSVALMSNMTALENVEFGLRIAGYPVKNRLQRAKDCLAMVGLAKRMTHMPQEMPGGEQQRVAIARAIAHKPKVVFADEPTAALDTSMGLQVIKVFRDLADQGEATIVMTTHDPNLMDIAERVYTLQDGELSDEY